MMTANDSLIRYELADESTGDEVFAFMMQYFRVMEPITSSLTATEDDLEDFFTDLKDNGVMSGHSFVAYEQDSLIGICLNSVYEVGTSYSVCVNNFDPMKDYKYEIETGSYKSMNANRIATFVSELDKDVKLAAPYARRIFKIDVICVSPNRARCGIGRCLIEKSLQEAVNAKCDCVASAATAKASQKLFEKFGFTCAKELPYWCFREDYRPVFQNLHDGGRSGKLMLLKL